MLSRPGLLTFAAATLLLSAGGLPLRTARALSLQPVEQTFELDGVPFKHWVFTDGPATITYSPPTNWRLVGYSGAVALYPPDGAPGEAKIVQLPVPKDRGINKATLDLMTRALHASLPPESQEVSDLDPRPDPVPIKDVPTGEVMCAYSAYGQKFKKAQLVMNHMNYQLSFTLVAPTNVFDRLHQEWLGSLFSWEWQPAR